MRKCNVMLSLESCCQRVFKIAYTLRLIDLFSFQQCHRKKKNTDIYTCITQCTPRSGSLINRIFYATHKIGCSVGGLPLWFTLERKHFNVSPGSALSSKSHANTIRLQVESSQSVSRAGIRHRACHRWLRQSLKPNTIWRAGRPPLLYLSIFMQRVLRILNTQSARASLGALYVNLQWYPRPHTLSAMYEPLHQQ